MEEDHGEERVPPSGGHLGPGGHLRGLRPRVPARAPAPRRALRPGGDLRLAARAARRERAHLTPAPEPAGRRGLGPTRPTPLRGPDRATYTARAPGAVAQLAERLHGMQEVRGSNPLSSTPGQRPYPVRTAPESSASRSRFASSRLLGSARFARMKAGWDAMRAELAEPAGPNS